MNKIKNYFYRIFNNDFNSFKYVKPKIGQQIVYEQKGNLVSWTNYTKDREVQEGWTEWKYYLSIYK